MPRFEQNLLLSIAILLLTVRTANIYGSSITCAGGGDRRRLYNCNADDLWCNAGSTCNIYCNIGDDRRRLSDINARNLLYTCYGGCCDANIHCPAGEICNINCNYRCHGLTVYAQDASEVHITRCDYCDDLTIHCPQNGFKGTDGTCTLQIEADINRLTVYAQESFHDFKLTQTQSYHELLSNPTIHCGVDPTTNPFTCQMLADGTGCINGASDCNDFRLPTSEPTPDPTPQPTQQPTPQPSPQPTPQPATPQPSLQPTDGPTDHPTNVPTDHPTNVPTDHPTDGPTDHPTNVPTDHPTNVPTDNPTVGPSSGPTAEPTKYPSFDLHVTDPPNKATPAPITTSTTDLDSDSIERDEYLLIISIKKGDLNDIPQDRISEIIEEELDDVHIDSINSDDNEIIFSFSVPIDTEIDQDTANQIKKEIEGEFDAVVNVKIESKHSTKENKNNANTENDSFWSPFMDNMLFFILAISVGLLLCSCIIGLMLMRRKKKKTESVKNTKMMAASIDHRKQDENSNNIDNDDMKPPGTDDPPGIMEEAVSVSPSYQSDNAPNVLVNDVSMMNPMDYINNMNAMNMNSNMSIGRLPSLPPAAVGEANDHDPDIEILYDDKPCDTIRIP